MSEIAEVEVIEPGTEVVPANEAPVSLFRTDDPVEVLTRAKATADALAPVIREAGLVANIQGKDYLNVEAWQTLGQQVGVTPVVTSTRRLSDPDGWEARCEARTLDGRTIGAADSMCLRTEERWQNAEDFEIRSMAQTRAMSRALASVLRFIPTLAGFGGTPAEEMDRVKAQGRRGQSANKGQSKGGFASLAQRRFLESLLDKAGFDANGIAEVADYMNSTMKGGRDGEISQAIDRLKGDSTRTETADRLGCEAREFREALDARAEGIEPRTDIPEGDGDQIPF